MKKVQILSWAFFLLLAALLLGLSACTSRDRVPAPAETAEPTTGLQPTPTPDQTPTPTPEPDYPPMGPVTVDGTPLASGSVNIGEIAYVSAPEYLNALGVEVTEKGDTLSFTWRKSEISLTVGRDDLLRDGAPQKLDGAVLRYHGEPWLPVRSVNAALVISSFDDEENNHLYCTPGAGDWALAEGYTVPVIMYHGVDDYYHDNEELYCLRKDMREQLQYYVDNGFQCIWFEDLEHIEDYDKPIILTFDDGMTNNYTNLLPLLKEFNLKATFFVITRGYEKWGDMYMTDEMIKEVSECGLVSVQSHSHNHAEMHTLSILAQTKELAQSKMRITRITGKEPFVFCYPRGSWNINTLQLMPDYFRFGVDMGGKVYVTGSDPLKITRFYVKRYYTAKNVDEMFQRAGLYQ